MKDKYDVVVFLARPVGLEVLRVLADDKRFRPSLVFTHKYERKALTSGEKVVRQDYLKFIDLARQHQIPIYNPTKERMTEMLRWRDYDFFISVNSTFIFPGNIIERARIAALNMHPSIARGGEIVYKGADPISRALANGDKEIGVNVHRLVEEVDAGEVLGCDTVAVNQGACVKDVYERLTPLYGNLLLRTLGELAKKHSKKS